MSDGLLPRRFDHAAARGKQRIAEAQERERSQGMPRHHRRYAWDYYGSHVLQYIKREALFAPLICRDEVFTSGIKTLASTAARLNRTVHAHAYLAAALWTQNSRTTPPSARSPQLARRRGSTESLQALLRKNSTSPARARGSRLPPTLPTPVRIAAPEHETQT